MMKGRVRPYFVRAILREIGVIFPNSKLLRNRATL
ncbi:MAG: hypothetical protein ACI97A_002585 [Planctomycetota bacterium]|jgi:hypothetical protein